MTSKEALETVKDYLLPKLKEDNSELGSIIIVESVNVLEKLVERDTPKKPTPQFPNTTFIYWCPECDCSNIQRYDKHCHDCGQRIDWSESK